MNVSVARPTSVGGGTRDVRQVGTLAKGRFVKGRVQASTSRVQGSKVMSERKFLYCLLLFVQWFFATLNG